MDLSTQTTSATAHTSNAPNAHTLSRSALAPYQYGTSFQRRRRLTHPAQPLIWAIVLVFVPLFWLTIVAWFARLVF